MGLTLPPTTIDAGAVVLRHLDADSAPALVAAINDNLDHLRPWMEWAQSPTTLPNAAVYLALQHERFLAGEDFTWSIFDGDRLVGGCGLHVRPTADDDRARDTRFEMTDGSSRELGYWVARDVEGRGYATAAGRALVAVAFDLLDLDCVTLRCSPANERSQAVARRLAFHPVDTVGDSMTWVLPRKVAASEDHPR